MDHLTIITQDKARITRRRATLAKWFGTIRDYMTDNKDADEINVELTAEECEIIFAFVKFLQLPIVSNEDKEKERQGWLYLLHAAIYLGINPIYEKILGEQTKAYILTLNLYAISSLTKVFIPELYRIINVMPHRCSWEFTRGMNAGGQCVNATSVYGAKYCSVCCNKRRAVKEERTTVERKEREETRESPVIAVAKISVNETLLYLDQDRNFLYDFKDDTDIVVVGSFDSSHNGRVRKLSEDEKKEVIRLGFRIEERNEGASIEYS